MTGKTHNRDAGIRHYRLHSYMPKESFTVLTFLLLTTSYFCYGGKVDVSQEITTLKQSQIYGSIAVQLSASAQTNPVNVTCRQIQSGSRRTNLRFSYIIIPVGGKNENVNARILSHGEAVSVACYGYSLNNGNQFFIGNSTGKLGQVAVSKAPTVSICDDNVYVLGYVTSFQSFTVKLSEPAVTPVLIQCSVVNMASSAATEMQLFFNQATVPQLQSQVTVQFRVQRDGTPVKVVCHAQSINCITSSNTTVATQTIIPSTMAYVTVSTKTINASSSVSGNSSPSSAPTSSNIASSSSGIKKSSSTPSSSLDATPLMTLNFTVNSTSFSTLMLTANSTTNLSLASVSSANETNVRANSAVTPNANISSINSKLPTAIFSSFSINKTTSLSASGDKRLTASVVSATALPTPTKGPVPEIGTCQYLFNTSKGPSVNFMSQQVSITAYPSYTDLSKLKTYVTYIALDAALQGSVNMDLQCRIRAIRIDQIEQTICGAGGAPIGGASEVVLSGITLRLLESKITFKPGEISSNITVEVVAIGNSSFVQLFHAYCCAPPFNEKYSGKSVSVFIWIDGKGILPFGWQNVTDQLQRQMTAVESLDFSCPCNLNENSCDLNCCCDKDCSSTETAGFVCQEGAFGGREKVTFEYDCNAVWPDRTDWTPFLCVVTNNSPLLGFFFKYTNPAIAASVSDFQRLTSAINQYTFEENEDRNTHGSSTAIGYEFGVPIRTDIGSLTVPFEVGGNSCAFTAVRYLMDSKSSCAYKATAGTCADPSFNAVNYLMPTGLSCSVPGVLDGKTSASLATKTVQYYCLSSSSDYVRIIEDAAPIEHNVESLFPPSVAVDKSIARCAFDDPRAQPPSVDNATNTCQNAVLEANYIFSWNGKQIDSVAAKITLGSFPVNTVTQSTVTYTYYTQKVVNISSLSSILSPTRSLAPGSMSASKASALSPGTNSMKKANLTSSVPSTVPHATVILPSSAAPKSSIASSKAATAVLPGTNSIRASLSVVSSAISPAPPNVMTITVQTSTVVVRNLTITPSVIQRFAVAYKYQRSSAINATTPVASNDTATVVSRSGNPGYVLGKPLLSQTNSTQNSSTTLGLLLWDSKKDGLCASASTLPVPFGKNSLSGCKLRLGLDRFSNCTTLRALVKSNQDKLATGIKIAKRGNPSASSVDDWLDIIRTEPTIIPRDLTRTGICYDVPSHLVIDVFISEAGMISGESQFEISGLRIRYITETWSMNCASGANSDCYNSTEASSRFTRPVLTSFFVTSSVSFIRIPAVDPPRIKRSKNTTGICRYDSCIAELFYPLLNAYSLNLGQFNLHFTHDATAMAMTLIFIAFGAFYMSQRLRN